MIPPKKSCIYLVVFLFSICIIYFLFLTRTSKEPELKFPEEKFLEIISDQGTGFQQNWWGEPFDSDFMSWRNDLQIQISRAKARIESIEQSAKKMTRKQLCSLLGSLAAVRLQIHKILKVENKDLSSVEETIITRADQLLIKEANYIYDKCDYPCDVIPILYRNKIASSLLQNMVKESIIDVEEYLEEISTEFNIPVDLLLEKSIEELRKSEVIDDFTVYQLKKIRAVYPKLKSLHDKN
jgi:hypothetical protein